MLRQVFKFLLVLAIFSAVGGLSAFFTLSFFIKSEETVIVPELTGRDAISVLQLLSGLELNTRVRGFEYHDAIPKNHVVHQTPEAGRTIKKGRDVSLVISRGTPTVTLPDLKRRDLSQAHIILEENGLVVGNKSFVYSAGTMRHTVLAQYPAPGKTVDRARPVDLLVSRGPRPAGFQMPDLTGRFLDETMQVLHPYKLLLDAVKTVYDKTKPENTVLRQEPPAGHYVEESQKVKLVVNRKEKDDEMRPAHADRLFTYRLPHGYLKQHVRLEMTLYGMTVTIYDELMQPGKEIWALVPEHAQAALFLYLNDELVESRVY